MPNSKETFFWRLTNLIQAIYRLLIELTNRRSTSILLAKLTKSKWSRFVVPSFSRVYKINLDEAEKSIDEYGNLHEFFTRKLKKNSRLIDQDPLSVISPVDAMLEDQGAISKDCSFRVKGKDYTISEMLGDVKTAQKYMNGTFMIFYLSPSDYHRIHSPISGNVIKRWSIGSKSYPVNKYGLKYGKQPLSKNYRTITEIENNGSSMAMVKVGAMFINSIEVIDEGDELIKGNEMAFFSFGSTVVLLFEQGAFVPALSSDSPLKVTVGDCIGYFTNGMGR